MPTILQEIANRWFLFEPTLFTIFLSHRLVENNGMLPLFRVGKMRIEYNAQMLAQMDDKGEIAETLLRYEMFRILLGHPYMRQPTNAQQSSVTLASNCVIRDNYPGAEFLLCPNIQGAKRGMCFEEYYALISHDFESSQGGNNESNQQRQQSLSKKSEKSQENDKQQENGDDSNKNDPYDNEDTNNPIKERESSQGESRGDENGEDSSREGDNREEDNNVVSRADTNTEEKGEGESSDVTDNNQDKKCNQEQLSALAEQSELWEEDSFNQATMCEIINNLSASNSWGTIPGDMVEQIKNSLVVKIDYRRILSMFRASVLSNTRHLTRMLPSRRYGFENMGSKRDMKSNLLVAIDASGSVSTQQVEVALAAINRTFKYGVEYIDIVTFDTKVYADKLINAKKIMPQITIYGRGGTAFQPVIDYYCNAKKYDGLIIITDGWADKPTLPQHFKGNILWMLYSDSAYKSCDRYTLDDYTKWIATFPRSRYLILPPIGSK